MNRWGMGLGHGEPWSLRLDPVLPPTLALKVAPPATPEDPGRGNSTTTQTKPSGPALGFQHTACLRALPCPPLPRGLLAVAQAPPPRRGGAAAKALRMAALGLGPWDPPPLPPHSCLLPRAGTPRTAHVLGPGGVSCHVLGPLGRPTRWDPAHCLLPPTWRSPSRCGHCRSE